MNEVSGGALAEGVRLLQSNDFTGAVNYLLQATRESPQDGRVFGYLGMAYAKLGDLNNSVLALQQATRLMPQDAGAHYNLAVGLAQANRLSEAKTALEQSLSLDPNNPKAQSAWQTLASVPTTPVASNTVPTPAGNPSDYSSNYQSNSSSGYQPSNYQSPSTGGNESPFDLSVGTPTYAAPQVPPAPASGYTAGVGYAATSPSPVLGLNGEPIPQVTPLPGNYQAPPMMVGQPMYGAPTSGPMPGGPMGGMQYNPAPRMSMASTPSAGKRIMRGLGWGALFGQWWTLWIVIWDLVIYGGGFQHPLGLVVMTIILAIFFAVVGAVAGLIIGVADLEEDKGMIVGIVFGILLLGCEAMLYQGNSAIFVNIFFWAFTGRFIGTNIARHVQKLVEA